MDKVTFLGTVTSVKARITLLRSFDQIPSHQYQGYTLVLDGTVGGETRSMFKVAIGLKAHEQHQFRIGDQVGGAAHQLSNPQTEWADFYKVSALKLLGRTQEESLPPGPEGGVAPPLPTYRAQGHFRLQKQTCNTQCARCPFGLTMATQMVIDHWKPSEVKWRFETHCYGPRGCLHYKSGPPYRVPGRKGMEYTDDDVERVERGEY